MNVRQTVFRHGFKVLKASGAGRVLAPLTQGFGAVFMLHHVRRPRADAFQPNAHLEISPEFLRFTVNRIREQGYDILHLDEAVDLLKSGYGRKRYAVLTFDDGYRDNLDVAYPILRELGAPFTVYITSGLIDRESELWWIALERLVANNDKLALSALDLEDGISCRTTEEKTACFDRMIDVLGRETTENEQRVIVRALAESRGLDLSAIADELMMDWDEVRQLASDPLVTIGAHTHDHFALARLDAASARADIMKGMKRLETELGFRPKHFAYPYGKDYAVCERDAAVLRDLGFSSSVTTFPGLLTSAAARDPMMLPRVSLNGRFQNGEVLDQYLTGAPFALYRAARWAAGGFGLKSAVYRLFPSTR
ncbi:MAG: polysaccharide deacetylase family protein [Roseibium sp.]|nr:polysaccharide deacetylase family protein [Roseibium sp.]